VISDKKTEKIARLISLVINKLEPTKILDEGSRLWDSLVEMKKNGEVFTHNELKNLQKIGRVLSDLKAKNPQYLNSSAEIVEISCSKCKKLIRTLKKFVSSNEKILCAGCLISSKEFRKKSGIFEEETQNTTCAECYKKLKTGAESIYFDAKNFCCPYCEYKTRVKEEKRIYERKKLIDANFKKVQKKQKTYQRKILAKKENKLNTIENRKLIDICQTCKLSIEDTLLEQNPNTKNCIVCTNEYIFPKKLCISCAQEIDPKLLIFRPHTHTCIFCQAKKEKSLMKK
jgi:RNA polymerase-binding transcription factor DksA